MFQPRRASKAIRVAMAAAITMLSFLCLFLVLWYAPNKVWIFAIPMGVSLNVLWFKTFGL